MKINSLTKPQRNLRKRILELEFRSSFSHLGSCLSAIDLIDCIYYVKKPDDKFVLSNGHAAIALYAVLEKYRFIKLPQTSHSLKVHPNRNPKIGIEVSTGSLGHGLPIALGMALASPGDIYYCMVSDGECAEGSIWEALRIIADRKVKNLKVIVNANGWGAYDAIDLKILKDRLRGFGFDVVQIDGHDCAAIKKALKLKFKKTPVILFAKTESNQFPFLKGLDAHYYIMNEADYQKALEILE